MSAFDEREQGFENRYAFDEALRFKALARRNKLLGLWAAEKMGLQGEAAAAYADALVERQVGLADDASLARSLHEAFASAKLDISTHRIGRKIEETMALATQDEVKDLQAHVRKLEAELSRLKRASERPGTSGGEPRTPRTKKSSSSAS